MPVDPWTTSVRYAATGRGHYESFYIKATHPARRMGLWLKFNLFEPLGAAERLEGELWGVWFDGEQGEQVVANCVLPRDQVDAHRGATTVRLGGAILDLGGEVLTEQARVKGGGHELAWDVRLQPLAPPIVHFPFRWFYEAGFPRKKLLTPVPRGRLDGWIEVDGVRHALEGWDALHGHNWGREHAVTYAYGNGVFTDGAYMDGFTARLKFGRRVSPWLSMVVVRLPAGRELAFNRPSRWLTGRPLVQDQRWEIDLPGADGTRARLSVSALARDMVGLRYRYPDGRLGFCANTKFAQARLSVEERGRTLYEGTSERAELETFGPGPAAGITFA